jgi:hypothetical protein
MTNVQFDIPPAIRLIVGVMFVLLSIPSFKANAVMWVFHGVDDRALGVPLAAFGCWAIYGGVRGLLRVRDATGAK